MSTQTNMSLEDTFLTLETIAKALNPDVTAPILNQLNATKSRYDDSYLNLAIIGEFNCGKSTFVNALFSRDILATAMKPTTAIPTYIRWTNQNNAFTVTAYDLHGKAYVLSNSEDKAAFEKLTGIVLPAMQEEVIDAVTTDNRLCDMVARIDVSAPYSARLNKICLIDTPGINPGTEGTDQHVRIAQQVLRDAADAALVMFPADRVLTADFKQFIEDHMSHLLHHSIFVLTQCDRIHNSKEMQQIADFAVGQMELIGVSNPKVHAISAASALDVSLGNDITETAREWSVQFDAMIDSIFNDLAERRNAIVHENVTSVIRQITPILKKEITKNKDKMKSAQKRIRDHSPKNMELACSQILNRYLEILLKVKNTYESRVETIVQAAIEDCKLIAFNDIRLAKTKEEVSSYMFSFGENNVKPVKSAIQKLINDCIGDLKGVLSKYKGELHKCVNQYVDGISALEINALKDNGVNLSNDMEGVKVTVSGFLTYGRTIKEAGDFIDEIRDSDSLGEGLFLTFAGLATLPFLMIGNVYNMFRPLDAIKQEARSRISTKLYESKGQFNDIATKAINTAYEAFMNNAQTTPDALKKTYASKYLEAERHYDQQKSIINNKMKTQTSQLKELDIISNSYVQGSADQR